MKILSVLWSLGFVVVRGILLMNFIHGDISAIIFAASEGLALAFTINGLLKGKVDGSYAGLWLPVCYMTPLLLLPTGNGFTWAPIALSIASSAQIGVRLWMGTRNSVGVPVWRKLLTTGPYQIIRHPLATSEIIVVCLFMASFTTTHNIAAGSIAICAITLGIMIEERFLKQFKEYQAYSANVKWRVLPGVW